MFEKRVTSSNDERPTHQEPLPLPATKTKQNQETTNEWTAIYETIQSLQEDNFDYLGSSTASEFWSQLRPLLLRAAAQKLSPDLRQKFDASDVAQVSMIEILAGLPDFAGKSPNQLRSWIYRIVQNNVTDVGRSYRNSQRRDISRETGLDDGDRKFEIQSDCRTASSLMIRAENEVELMKVILQLPQRGKQVLELRHHYEMNYAEISTEMGITEVAARKLYSRTIAELRNRLSQNATDNDSGVPTVPT